VTLRTRLTAAFLMVVLVPLLLGGVLLFALLPSVVDGLQGGSLRSTARLVLASVDERCERAQTVAATVARVTGDGERLQQVAERLVVDGQADGVQVLGAGGRELATAGAVPGGQRPDCAERTVVRTGEQVQLVATQPLDLGGGAVGAVVAAVAVDDASVTRLSEAADASVVLLEDERVLVGSGAVDERLLAAALRQPDAQVRSDGRVARLVRSGSGPGSLGVLVAQESWVDLSVLQVVFPFVVVGSGALAVVIAWGLARATTSPLEELGRGASRVADGDLTTVIDVRARDEVGQLAAAFNRMTEQVRRQVEALEDSGRQLRAGVARLGDALGGTHNLDRLLTVVLDAATAATGARAGAVLLRDAATGELTVTAGRNLAERGVPTQLRVPADAGITGAVARSGRPVLGRSGRARRAAARPG
jgi:HAMP domain-containing protein